MDPFKAQQEIIKKRFASILEIMTKGCGREYCPNVYCLSSPFYIPYGTKEKLGAQALTLAKESSLNICLTSQKSPLSIQSNEFDSIMPKMAPTEDFNMQPYGRRVLDVFHNIESLSLSFRSVKDLKQFKPSETDPFLDFAGLNNFFLNVMPRLKVLKEELLKSVRLGIQNLVKNPEFCRKTIATHTELRVILICLQLPEVMQFENKDTLIDIIQLIRNLPEWAYVTLKNWLGTLAQNPFINVVSDLQQFITLFVLQENQNFEQQLQMHLMERIFGMAIKPPDYSPLEPIVYLLQILYEANSISHNVGKTHFQNNSLANDYTVLFQYKIWKNSPNEFSFCKYRWLLDIDFKAKTLEEESKEEMENEKKKGLQSLTQMLHDSRFNMMLNPSELINFTLSVRRDRIIEDSLNGLAQMSQHSSFKKKLKVKFIGEPGVDEGGVKKEYFQILMKSLFDPMYGMFVEKMNQTLYWFNECSFECNLNFELIGMMLGLAIYNSINLDLRFPPLVFKKLLNENICLADLKTFDHDIYMGLTQLLAFEGNVEEIYCRTFQIEYESSFGERIKYDLKPNGDKIPVTNENRKEFVELYIDWMVNTSVEKQFEYFKKGFEKVVSGEAIKLLTAEELNILICGTPKIDLKELMRVAVYEGFQKDSQIIKDFWEVLSEFSDEQLKKFLFFCTGSDRVPITGLTDFIIMKHGEDSEHLPTAHTCFNHLLLPEYSSKAKLKEKLLVALNNSEGFGLL